MPTPLRWEKTEPNLFIVRYQTGADLEPALQSSLVQAVRVAANAFRMASTVAGLPLTVAAFATEAEGSAWARKTLAQATPRSA